MQPARQAWQKMSEAVIILFLIFIFKIRMCLRTTSALWEAVHMTVNVNSGTTIEIIETAILKWFFAIITCNLLLLSY